MTLVRDKIIEWQKEVGDTREVVIADIEDRLVLFCAKLIEEAVELQEDPTDINEYADVMEVLNWIIHESHFTHEEVETRMLQKRKERGDFNKGYVLLGREK